MLPRASLPAFKTTSAGMVNKCFMPGGVKLMGILLALGDDNGTTLASGDLIEDITLRAFTKEQRVASAVQWNALNALRGPQHAMHTHGDPGTAAYRTYFPIWFFTPWLYPRDRAKSNGWNLVPGMDFTLEVEVADGVNNPVLEGIYLYDDMDGGINMVEQWERTSLKTSGASNEHTELVKTGLIQSMHIFPNTTYVSEVSITRNRSDLWKTIGYRENQATLLGMDLFPDTTANPRFDIFFDDEDPDNLGLSVNGLNELKVKTTYAANADNTMDAIISRLAPIQGA